MREWSVGLSGAVGFVLLLLAGLLGARRTTGSRGQQRGSRAHVWFGLLSVPLILVHAGFRTGGLLTSLLVWLLVVVTVSGMAGAWVRQMMPRLMSGDGTLEAIGKQVARERAQLIEQGDRIAADACGTLEIAMPPSGVAPVAPAIATLMRIRAGGWRALGDFYLSEMRPFILGQPGSTQLDDPERAQLRFETLRTLLPVSLHVAVGELERIYEHHRELTRYVRLSMLLEAWLLVHVPLAFTLIALALVHVIAVWRY